MSVSRIRLSVYLRVALQSFTFDSATHRILAIPLNVVKSLRVESEVVAQMYLYFHDICRNRSIAHQIRLTTGAGYHPFPFIPSHLPKTCKDPHRSKLVYFFHAEGESFKSPQRH